MAPKSGINLLPKDLAQTPGLRYIKKGTIAITSLYIIVMLGLFGFLFFIDNQKKTLNAKNDSLKKEVASLKDKEGKLITLKDRVVLSKQTFLSTQAAPHEIINNALNIMPSEIEFTKIEVEENGEISLVATSPTSKSISQYFLAIKEKKYSEVILDTFVLQENGTYLFSLNLK